MIFLWYSVKLCINVFRFIVLIVFLIFSFFYPSIAFISFFILFYFSISIFRFLLKCKSSAMSTPCGEVRKESYGFNGCSKNGMSVGPLMRKATLETFMNIIRSDQKCTYAGFMFHPTLGYGKMIKTYPAGCASPENESWPLYLIH